MSHPLLRRQFIFERIFSPPSTEVAAVAICHLLDNFCHQLAAKSTSAKTKSEDAPGAWLRVCGQGPHARGRGAGGVSAALPSLPLPLGLLVRGACAPPDLFLQVYTPTYFLGHIRRHHIVINSQRRSAIDQCAAFAGRDGWAGLNCLVFPIRKFVR